MTIYLDCNASTPIETEVLKEVTFYLETEYGNSGSRTHEFGLRAKKAVNHAREDVAEVVNADPEEVIFTSGATESNNLSILGIEKYSELVNKKHVVSTSIEHKAVLDPLSELESKGFSISYVNPDKSGAVDPLEIIKAVKRNTVLVSVMHVNNETGIIQPISEIANLLDRSLSPKVLFHTDAAQGFGKDIESLRNQRIDMISISGHKLHAPMGVGALIMRNRDYDAPPLAPITFGGGQEKRLRPGTLPVPLIVGLGKASRIALRDNLTRKRICQEIKEEAIKEFTSLNSVIIGDLNKAMPHVLNIAFPGTDAEAVLLLLKGLACASTGSACTSQSFTPSHVLTSMGLSAEIVNGAIRFSWCHLTGNVPWAQIAAEIRTLV